jgi:hypothetical protein
MRASVAKRRRCRVALRTGSTSLDYVLILGVTLPMAAFVIKHSKLIMERVYEMTSVLISWPFM